MFENLHVAPGLAFLFDMDGVIVESTVLHTRAWELYLSRLGVDSKGIMARMLGKRNDQIVRDVFGPDLPESEVFRHGAEKEQLYREMMAPVLQAQLVPGVVEFVRTAHAQGVPCALTTNAEPLNVDFVLGGAGLTDCFQTIVDGHQVSRPKPDPEVYLTATARLGQNPANCVVFEDSPGGMQAARAAGAHLVGLLTTLSDAPLAGLAVPDFLDERLLPWISALRAL
ncbi:HAD family phosphatase [uncultured Paludibaculum sp.]|uniref:HAD family hydrolase n=1 Tax=uncultured Paludibaculum sp. TaxID=1765020 RepID=UPI002AAAE675|nr:HAD family phosphatase [uncultured Paludibaculum sp.]